MERSQARALVVLAVVLLVITGLLYALPERGSDREDSDATVQIWKVDPEAIAGVRLERPESTVVLKKVGDGVEPWRLMDSGGACSGPDGCAADPDAMAELLDELAGIERGVAIPGGAAAPGDFGLATPRARVTVELAGEASTTASVDLGDPAPVGYRTYARTAAGEVVALEGRPVDLATAPADRFRDHRVVRFDPAAVRAVRIEGPDGVLAVAGEGQAWWLEGFTRADPDRVDDLVMSLLDMRYDALGGVEAIGAPRYTVRVSDDRGQDTLIEVGSPLGSGAGTPLRSGAAGGTIAEARLAFLGQGPTDLGDPRAIPVDPDRSDEIAVTGVGPPWVAVRDGTAWALKGAESSPEVDAAVRALAAARIRYEREPIAFPDGARVEITVKTEGREQTIWVAETADALVRVARDAGGGEPYRVPAAEIAVIEALPR